MNIRYFQDNFQRNFMIRNNDFILGQIDFKFVIIYNCLGETDKITGINQFVKFKEKNKSKLPNHFGLTNIICHQKGKFKMSKNVKLPQQLSFTIIIIDRFLKYLSTPMKQIINSRKTSIYENVRSVLTEVRKK